MSGASDLEVAKDIGAMTRKFLDDSMGDPDIASRSDDYREGYRRGFAEAAAVLVAKMIQQRERRT